jgi:hypothetical protein
MIKKSRNSRVFETITDLFDSLVLLIMPFRSDTFDVTLSCV